MTASTSDILHQLSAKLPGNVTKSIKGTPVETIYQWLRYRQTRFEHVTFKTPIGEIDVRLPEKDKFDRHQNNQGGHEPHLIEELKHNLNKSSVYYDVGSHFGYQIAVALKLGVSPKNIHSFDANSFRAYTLSQHFDNINISRAFVGSSTHNTRISLDTYTHDFPDPDVVKIDVEGAELKAIQGMEDTIQSSHPLIYIEIHPNRMEQYQDNPEKLFEYLNEKGYKLSMVDHRNAATNWEPATAEKSPAETYLLRAKPV